MPKIKTTFKDIEKGVKMHSDGHTFLEIAKSITIDNIETIDIDEELRKAVLEMNENRGRYYRLTNIILDLKNDFEISKETEDLLTNNIVTEFRIKRLAKTEKWKEYTEIYEEHKKKNFADSLSKE